MTIIKIEDEKKWINAFIAIICAIIAFVAIRFLVQIGEWFDLESKVEYYTTLIQGVGIAIGALVFVIVRKHKKAAPFMSEVYKELVKVVWPDKESVVKLTIGIVIALIIVSLILGLIDYLAQGGLNLFYNF